LLNFISSQYNIQTEYKKDASMQDVSEHDPEKEWEGYDREQSRVELLVPWYAVCIDNRLEHSCEIVQLITGRRDLVQGKLQFLNLPACKIHVCFRNELNSADNLFFFYFGTPKFAFIKLAIRFEQVQS